MPDFKGIGKTGEEIAQKYLSEEGYMILERNFKTKLGEIDIVARDGDYIVFIEVKSRIGTKYGYPREAVDGYKQVKLRNLASLYTLKKRLLNSRVRFDVVEVIMENSKEAKSVTLIKNAF